MGIIVAPENSRVVSNQEINISGYMCPFIKENPVVVELPMMNGHHVPVFKELSVLEDAMRYLQVKKYRIEIVGIQQKFLEVITSGGAKIVINPKSYNGITIWDNIIPEEDPKIIL
jgi:hypothetical protein